MIDRYEVRSSVNYGVIVGKNRKGNEKFLTVAVETWKIDAIIGIC